MKASSPPKISSPLTTSSPLVTSYETVIRRLDGRDNQLIDLARKNKTQAEMARSLGISTSAIQKRLDKLCDSNLIIKINSRPRFYDINPAFDDWQKNANQVLGVPIHKQPIKLEVRGNHTEFEALRNQVDVEAKLNNWTRKFLKENNVIFILNKHCIIFHIQGIGKTPAEAKDNVKEKAVKIRYHLESKYNLSLGFPEFMDETNPKITGPHLTPGSFKKENVEEMKKNLWIGDGTHPNLLETNDPHLAKQIVESIEKSSENESRLTGIEATLDQLKSNNQRLDKIEEGLKLLADGQGKIINSLNSLNDTLKGLSSNSQNRQDPTGPSNDSLFT